MDVNEKEQTTEEKLNKLGELADKLDELDRLKREVKIQSWQIAGMKERHAREDKVRKILLIFFAGVCYGILTTTILGV